MSDFEEAYKRNQEIIRKGKELLGQAKKQIDEKEKLYNQYSITPEAVKRFIDSEHLTPEQKQQVKQQLQAEEEGFGTELQQMRSQHQAEKAHRGHAKKPHIKRLV